VTECEEIFVNGLRWLIWLRGAGRAAMIRESGESSAIDPPIRVLLMAYFINRDAGRRKETVDEYETKVEALRMVPEYQMTEHGRAFYYVSGVACANWKR